MGVVLPRVVAEDVAYALNRASAQRAAEKPDPEKLHYNKGFPTLKALCGAGVNVSVVMDPAAVTCEDCLKAMYQQRMMASSAPAANPPSPLRHLVIGSRSPTALCGAQRRGAAITIDEASVNCADCLAALREWRDLSPSARSVHYANADHLPLCGQPVNLAYTLQETTCPECRRRLERRPAPAKVNMTEWCFRDGEDWFRLRRDECQQGRPWLLYRALAKPAIGWELVRDWELMRPATEADLRHLPEGAT